MSGSSAGLRRLRPQLSELVSLVERVRWLTGLRIGLALTALAGVTLVPELRGVSATSLLAATGAYLFLSAAAPVLIRSSRTRALIAIGGTLLVDGVYLAWVSYATGGISSPLRFLIYLHVAAVTLAASYRTGFKLAAWHSLLFFVTHYAGAAGFLDVGEVEVSAVPIDGRFWTLAASTVGAVWAVALVSAAFSSVNERELRTQKADLDDLSAMVREMEESAGTPEICRVLLDELCRVFGFARGVVLASPNGTLEVMASRGRVGESTIRTPDGVDPIMRETWNERRVRLVRAVDPAIDPWIAALVPEGRDLVLAPMTLPGGGRIGIAILEHPGGGGIKRWVVSLVEQYVAHAALALHNTWLVAELEDRLQENRALQQRLVAQNSSLEMQVQARTRELTASLQDLQLADDERRRILARLVDAQEEERQRVADDIHDDPIQKLVAISMRLQLLKKQDGEGSDPSLDDLIETVRQTIKGMRHMIFELRPTVLDDLGVAAALVEYLETVGVSAEFEVQDDLDEEPDGDLGLILYRIAQEALANVRKHSNASRVHVSLAQHDGGYLVRIEDNGDGFDPPEMLRSSPGHLGLSSMRERAEMVGGWCKVHGLPGNGTTVEFWVPQGASESLPSVDPADDRSEQGVTEPLRKEALPAAS
ncbi:MAG: ATP-binding protein [Actinomycetota bacterium]